MLLEEAEIKLNSIDKNNAPIPGRNKGGRGQWVERQLGLDLGSNLIDFDNGEGKTFKEGEPIAVTMLQHCFDEVFDRSISFSESKVGKKLKNVLFVKFAKKTGKFVGSLVTNVESHRELYYKLSEDYNDVCEGIRRCYENKEDVHTINGRNGYLQIRSKANKTSKGVYNPLVYNGQQVYHCAMAFYLRNKFARVIFS
jgi:DNA mismatch repair protein MutH